MPPAVGVPRAPAVLLGIDPGLASTGYGVLDADGRVRAFGTVRTAPGPDGPRLVELVERVEAIVAEHGVTEAALEEIFLGRNRSSAIGVAQARGALLFALSRAGVPAFDYKPSQVKAVVTGFGAAGKEQVARMLQIQGIRLEGRFDDHAADAVAIALCHSRSRRLRALVTS